MTDKDQLEEAFAQASELTRAEQEAFLTRFSQEHPDLVDHLRKLLEADADTERTVGDAVVSSLERIELDEAGYREVLRLRDAILESVDGEA